MKVTIELDTEQAVENPVEALAEAESRFSDECWHAIEALLAAVIENGDDE